MIILKVCTEFTDTPGARYIEDGDFSGEQFRDELLLPKYNESKEKGETLIVDLDGGYGYATSFLDEAFGGLARIYRNDDVLRRIEIISNDEPGLIDDIKDYVKNANDPLRIARRRKK